MSLIKQAIVFKAEIPTDIVAIDKHLQEQAFTELLQAQANTAGFVPVTDEHGLVAPFHGGLAFRVRYDEKIVPASVIRDELAKQVALIEKETGRKPGKKEKAAIREVVIYDLTCRALSRTVASITCFYHAESGYLIVPTTNKRLADICVTKLILAVGSVKTETIHVSNVKHGLTTRLKNWLGDQSGEFSDGEGFDGFEPCDQVAMAGDEKRQVTVKMTSLDSAEGGIKEAMSKGLEVTSLGLRHDGNDFRLSHDFRLRGIKFPVTDDEGEGPTWESVATLQVEAVRQIIAQLCEMLSYKDEAALEGGAA